MTAQPSPAVVPAGAGPSKIKWEQAHNRQAYKCIATTP